MIVSENYVLYENANGCCVVNTLITQEKVSKQ